MQIKAILLLAAGAAPICASAQYGNPVRLTIDLVYQLARWNYPQSRDRDLLAKTEAYRVENAARGYLPQVNFSGQASLQSDVINFPIKVSIPGFDFPQYSKDQYKLYGEVDQVIYDGGAIRNQKEAARTDEQVQQANLDVALYTLYDRVNQLYFGILLINEELRQNELLEKQLRIDMDDTRAMIAHGTAYSSGLEELQAQFLQADQQRVEESTQRQAYLRVLGMFTALALDDRTVLETPPDPGMTDSIVRPELTYYEYQKRSFDLQDALAVSQLRPRVSFFIQGGYARPGLNMLSNDFAWYWIGGLRMTWNLGGLYTLRNQKRISDLGRRQLDVAKETFLFNTHASQLQNSAEITRDRELIKDDELIVSHRRAVRDVARAQMELGVLSFDNYIQQLLAHDQSVQTEILHKVQLLQAEYNYRNLSGNP